MNARADPYVPAATALLRALFGDAYLRDFAVALWDGSFFEAEGPQRFVLCVNEPGALRSAFTPPLDLGLGRAFARGALDVRGSVESAVDAFLRAAAKLSAARMLRIAFLLRRLPNQRAVALQEAALRGRRHSRARDRAAIRFHYDLPVEFYRAFLDSELVYSCAFYDDDIETLDDAQVAKLDYVLRKLRLKPGERLLDVGCGWGALVLRAAERFGARVLGITLSRTQYDEANRRIAAAGIGDRARVELRDYRDLGGERFDKIVSIGMFEHVGRRNFARYFRAIYESLRPGGLFLNGAIALEDRAGDTGRAGGFMDRFVFPDGELVPISDALSFAQDAGFEVRDLESLREHYARTLRDWVANLERNRDEAVAVAGEQNYRTWRLYMAGSAQGFSAGRLNLYHALLARPDPAGHVDIPATRRDLLIRGTNSVSDPLLQRREECQPSSDCCS